MDILTKEELLREDIITEERQVVIIQEIIIEVREEEVRQLRTDAVIKLVEHLLVRVTAPPSDTVLLHTPEERLLTHHLLHQEVMTHEVAVHQEEVVRQVVTLEEVVVVILEEDKQVSNFKIKKK